MPAKSIKVATPDHPVLPAIVERWSPYAYDPRPVEREKLLSCLEAARWAASSYNEQPWTYILAERGDAQAFSTMLGCLVEGNQAWAKNAGVLLLGIVKRNFAKNNTPNRVCEHDLGLASGNMVLQATALGLQAHQMAGIEPVKIRATYHVPDGHEPLTGIAIGYPAAVQSGTSDPLGQRDLTPRTRRKLSEFVIAGSWGQPAKLA
jgi:nitroreductase